MSPDVQCDIELYLSIITPSPDEPAAIFQTWPHEGSGVVINPSSFVDFGAI